MLSQQVLKHALPSDGPQVGDTQESRSGEAPVTTEQSKRSSGQCSTPAITVCLSGTASGIVMVQLCVSNCFSYFQHLF